MVLHRICVFLLCFCMHIQISLVILTLGNREEPSLIPLKGMEEDGGGKVIGYWLLVIEAMSGILKFQSSNFK